MGISIVVFNNHRNLYDVEPHDINSYEFRYPELKEHTIEKESDCQPGPDFSVLCSKKNKFALKLIE